MPLKYNPERDPEPTPSAAGAWGVALVAILSLLGVWYYYTHTPDPAPEPVKAKPRHLAPEGTFYVVEYIAAPIKTGVVGFEPGRMVHLVKVLQEKHKLIVSDGQYEAEADPDQLTNDLEIAELARLHDAASQGRLAQFQSAEKARYEKEAQAENELHARDVASYNAQMTRNMAVGTSTNSLNKGSEPTRSFVYPSGAYYYGSPYSYFSTPYYNRAYP